MEGTTVFTDSNGDPYGQNNPLVIAGAGLCKEGYATHIEDLKRKGADLVVVGSVTLDARAGNTGPRREYFENPAFGLNVWGMPNPGIDVILDRISDRSDIILNLAGFSVDEYVELYRIARGRVPFIELNFGCPNVWENGERHPIVSYDPNTLNEILRRLGDMTKKDDTVIGVKLSPYNEDQRTLLEEVADVINATEVVDYVATTNTIPVSSATLDNGEPALLAYDAQGTRLTQGGLSGAGLRELSSLNARLFRRCLDDRINVIRVGGVANGDDLHRAYQEGAIGAQVVTAHYQRKNPRVFQIIKEEYAHSISE